MSDAAKPPMSELVEGCWYWVQFHEPMPIPCLWCKGRKCFVSEFWQVPYTATTHIEPITPPSWAEKVNK